LFKNLVCAHAGSFKKQKRRRVQLIVKDGVNPATFPYQMHLTPLLEIVKQAVGAVVQKKADVLKTSAYLTLYLTLGG
jgi:hypothetical protein